MLYLSRALSVLPLVGLALLSFAPSAAVAVQGNHDNNPQFAPLHLHQTPPPRSSRLKHVFPQLTWLRDTAIEKIFGAHPKSVEQCDHAKASSQLPATLLAQYGGDVVLRFNISTSEEVAALSEAADTLFLDVWEFTGDWVDIRLRKDDVPSLLGLLPDTLHTAYSHLMPDLARTIYQSYPTITFAEPALPDSPTVQAFTPSLQKNHQGVENIFFQQYQPLSVIVPWMRLMASMFPTHVKMTKIGVSYEGRDIHALRVGVHPSNAQKLDTPRKTIIVNGGTHAREWISVSSVTYAAWSLITSYGKSKLTTKLLQEFDFVLIPTLNVDGYVYTWETDRLWRKNRQQTNLRFCPGLDLDRGFGFAWDGTSFQSNPCSESYPGDEPFQAVESHRLAEWAKNETDNHGVKFVGFLDLHSYSQQVLYPYSYSCDNEPSNSENLMEVGLNIASMMHKSSGRYYTVMSACEGAMPIASTAKSSSGSRKGIEAGGGSAIDWFYHELDVRYAFQIKLRDTGSYGFLLPSEHIIPTGDEVYSALKFMADFIGGNNGRE